MILVKKGEHFMLLG